MDAGTRTQQRNDLSESLNRRTITSSITAPSLAGPTSHQHYHCHKSSSFAGISARLSDYRSRS